MGRAVDDADKPVNAPADESALQRWARRKKESRALAEAPDTEPMAADVTAEAKPAEAEQVLTDADMPPIELLDKDSDFSSFMSPGVSEELRTAALRKLFRSGLYDQCCPLESEYFDGHGLTPLGNVITHEMRSAMAREAEVLKRKAKEVLLADKSPRAKPARTTKAAATRQIAAPASQATTTGRSKKLRRVKRSTRRRARRT